MEFKFSCKWFEVALGGDPGFVDVQLAKYEPYIMNALKKIEQEPVESQVESKAPPARPASALASPTPVLRPVEAPKISAPRTQPPSERGQDQRGRESRGSGERRGRDRNRWERRRRDNQPRKEAVASEAVDELELPGEVEAGANHSALPTDVAQEQVREAMHDIASGAVAAELPFEEARAAEVDDASVALAPSPAPAASEFALHRRAPRIAEDELKRVMEAKKPRTHHDRIMVFGHYMEQDGEGSDFTIAEIVRCYRAVGQDPGINIEQVINHATRSGFILSQDKGRAARYKLSNKGRRYVEDGLRLS